jgi:hypothetical protein
MMRIEHEVRFRRGAGGRGRGRQQGWGGEAAPPDAGDAAAWFAGRLPEGWFTGAPDVSVDRDEIVVVGTVEAPEGEAAEAGRITRFREETREARIEIANEAEQRYGRKVAWGATAGGTTELFTTISVPVMTRLRQQERRVLDTLVDAGVARSRSDALAWCVKLVGHHQEEWIAGLREALVAVEEARSRGPEVG